MILETIKIADIKIGKNPRVDLKPGDPEYTALKSSMERWGVVQPLVWNRRSGNLVGGHQRLKLLVADGHEDVEVSVVDLPPSEEMALNIALNKIEGKWDNHVLFETLSELSTVSDGISLLTLTGFDGQEFADLSKSFETVAMEPLFAPTLQPATEKVIEQVTAKDIERAEDKQANRFAAHKINDVTCPHCGNTFGLKGDLVKE